ncbi:hypothetical protein, partial [Moorena sp. SIO3I8]|uniref:hypothetical protein n=1 Tax=Moorena sp. SIO3I8 TaxID=2607833 RepID=UPI0025EF789D
ASGQFLKRMAHISSPLKIIILHLDSLHSSMARKSEFSLPKAGSQILIFSLLLVKGTVMVYFHASACRVCYNISLKTDFSYEPWN